MKRTQLFVFTCNLFIIIVLPKLLVCYNVDTNYTIEFQGAVNSYFGYSLSLLKGKNTNWLIVGAPRANSSSLSGVNEPGEILKCEITLSSTTSCSALLKNTADDRKPKPGRTENSWLGVSVDSTPVDNGRVVACAHRWIDKSSPYDPRRSNLGYPVRGVCYTTDSEFGEDSFEALSPLTSGDQYGFAQLGISAHFVKNSDSLLMGAPGTDAKDFRGSAVSISRENKDYRNVKSYELPIILDAKTNIEYNTYFGYAVTSGNFEKNRKVLFAIGAPRKSYYGEVYIVSAVGTKKLRDYDIKVSKIGEQLGEYFGSSVCAIDFNNDGLDDLLVGAPLHSTDVDEGKVYVFINAGSLQLQPVGQGLTGSSVPNARFGSAITNIGDINMDGFPDMAVGAPFEDERGAVYIYHGAKNGFKPQFQKILAFDASPHARGFGMAISRAMDVDDNFYPDIAIGSFQSDQAFLFRSRPIVYLSGSINSNISSFNLENKVKCAFGKDQLSCFHLSICLSYNGSHVPTNLKIKMTLAVDTRKEKQERVQIKTGNIKSSALESKMVTLLTDQLQCVPFEIIALTTPIDFFTPIFIHLKYDMVDDSPTKKFCSNCPVVDKPEENRKLTTVRFLKHCGTNDNCVTDLQLEARFRDLEPSEALIIGSRERVELELNVSNSAENAYATRVIVQVPKWMSIDLIPPNCVFFLEEVKESHLDCLVANPLKQNKSTGLVINLNIQKIPVRNGFLNVNVSVTSDSSEDNDKNNHVRLSHDVIVEADITVIGSNDNRRIFYLNDANGKILDGTLANFSHSYEIFNNGPSTVNSITIEVRYPSETIEGKVPVMQMIAQAKRNGFKGAVFGSCNEDNSYSPVIPESRDWKEDAVPHHQRNRRELVIDDFNSSSTNESTDILKSNNYFQMNCSTFKCKSLKCTVGPFKKKTTASLMVMFSIDLTLLRALSDKFDGVMVTSEGLVSISGPNIQPMEHLPDKAFVSTEITPVQAPVALPIAWWIIPVSIIGGVLLLILISVGLVKAGFFRRKNKEDLEKLRSDYEDKNVPPQDDDQGIPPYQGEQ